MIRTYRVLPEVVSGYGLDDVWAVVVPVARTNLCINPSFETNTTSWTAIGGSIARSTAQQYHGAYSLAITPTAATTDGARYDTVSLTSGITYAYSAKVRGVGGLKYKLALETTGGVELNAVTFTASGRWQWIVGYYTETSTTTRRLTVRKASHTSVAIFYLDGAQVEQITAGELASTYLDGDQLGLVPNQSPPAYVWNGTPHASTSTRSAQTRAGGMVVPFKKYGFLLTAIIGLGLAGVANIGTDYARIDGAYDDYTRKPPRQFTLTGRFQGRTYGELRRNRSGLSQLLDRDLTGQDQRLTLLRYVEDGNGRIVSSTTRALVKYESGLGGNTDNQHAETTPITFTQYLPGVLSDAETGASLGVQATVASVARAAERLPNGTWRALSSTLNNAVNALLYATDGSLVIAGDFTVPQTRVARWDGTTLSAMGAGLANSVLTLDESPDGTIYAGGASVTISAVAGTVTRFTGGAWAVVGATGVMTGQTAQLLFARDGTLYAVGTSATSKATLHKWDGSTWTSLFASAANGDFFSVVEGNNNNLFIGGLFSNLNADADQDNIVEYDIINNTWSALGTGFDFQLEGDGLAMGLDGRLYAIGAFTTAGGVTANHAAVWNGVSWAELGSGLTSQGVQGSARTLPDGSILMGGSFTLANGVTFPDPMARWNGSTFVPLDANLPTGIGTAVLGMGTAIDGRLAVGWNAGSTSITTAATTTVTNLGTAKTYPTLTIKGPTSGTARLWQIVNVTTGRAIYFNYTINAGETAVLVLQPDSLSFVSDFQGNVMSSVLPGSNIADFFLQPGSNIISFFSASDTVTATLSWRTAYASLDDVP